LAIHTERGAAAEELPGFFASLGLRPERLVICHIDKRPDFGLHRELAAAGALLEYDTFYRPKYDPERGVWPLLERMIEAGLAGSLALATDMAERELWESLGSGPGLPGFLTVIGARLRRMGVPAETLAGLLGGNIARRLVPDQPAT
jgi:predicted metal-dependent phosphotriesterase family hydrolase